MDDIIHLNRFRKRILTVLSDLVLLNTAIEELAQNPIQSNVNKVADKLSKFDGSVSILRDSLGKVLNEIAGIEDDEIDAEVTEEGNIL